MKVEIKKATAKVKADGTPYLTLFLQPKGKKGFYANCWIEALLPELESLCSEQKRQSIGMVELTIQEDGNTGAKGYPYYRVLAIGEVEGRQDADGEGGAGVVEEVPGEGEGAGRGDSTGNGQPDHG